ncbi:MAG TPA: YCF48-related protein [Vicinamibacterales bacterium]|nr:YCF48-related protein [Vicinamibacterales bacterium]
MTHADICPDAETLAAWYDQGLPPAERARIDAHVSTCDRCQTIVATLARADVPALVPAREPSWWSWRWLAPIAAGVAAVVVWALVRPGSAPTVQPPVPASLSARAEPSASPPASAAAPPLKRAPEPAPPVAQRERAVPTNAPPVAPPNDANELRRADERAGNVAFAPAAPPAPSAAAGAIASARTLQATLDAVAAPDIVSSDPSVRWRIRGAVVEHSTDGGATWTPQATGTSAVLTAGMSPNPDVCWIVGRAGTVLRTTDGQTWETVAFPERVDLVRVEAAGMSTATVTTADARRFTTEDGGITWTPARLQEF